MNISVSITAEALVKTCTGCKVVKPVEEFALNGRAKRCRACEHLYHEERTRRIIEIEREREREAERKRERARRYREENREKLLEGKRRDREANPGKFAERNRRYYEENRESFIAYARGRGSEHMREHYEANREKYYARNAARRADKLNATPPWVNRADIVAVYTEAARLTEETGVVHHVDHIIPLKNDYVCGLHVPWNLRAIPADENLSKSNRLSRDDGVNYFEECLS